MKNFVLPLLMLFAFNAHAAILCEDSIQWAKGIYSQNHFSVTTDTATLTKQRLEMNHDFVEYKLEENLVLRITIYLEGRGGTMKLLQLPIQTNASYALDEFQYSVTCREE